MAKYLKNTTQNNIKHNNSGINFIVGQYQIATDLLLYDDQTYGLLYQNSVSGVGFVFNDGEQDFSSPTLAWDALRGIYPREIAIIDPTNGRKGSIDANGNFRTTSTSSSGSGGGPSAWSKYFVMLDMNETTGGVARETGISTTYVNVYSYNGFGLLAGFILTLESLSDSWIIRLQRDRCTTFELNTADMSNHSIYGLNRDWHTIAADNVGLNIKTNSLYCQSPLFNPWEYEESVVLSVKRAPGKSNKKFKAGLMTLTQEPT